MPDIDTTRTDDSHMTDTELSIATMLAGIDLDTTITTAARRIAREAHTAPIGTRIAFDRAGHEQDRTYGHEQFPPTGPVIVTVTPTPVAQRHAQDLLDAAAWSAELDDQGLVVPAAVDRYLAALEHGRESRG